MDELSSFLHQIHPLKDEVVEEYTSHWSEFTSPRKSILTKANQREGYIYFVIEGIQKSYYLHDGKEHVMFFAYPPSFSGVLESFFTQSPSHYYLETLTDCHFLRLPYARHQALMEKHREIETLFRKITESFLLGVIERQHELLTFKAEDRFKRFVKRSPHLLNMVPQKDLASYLRIDPTNFSKMINRFKI